MPKLPSPPRPERTRKLEGSFNFYVKARFCFVSRCICCAHFNVVFTRIRVRRDDHPVCKGEFYDPIRFSSRSFPDDCFIGFPYEQNLHCIEPSESVTLPSIFTVEPCAQLGSPGHVAGSTPSTARRENSGDVLVFRCAAA